MTLSSALPSGSPFTLLASAELGTDVLLRRTGSLLVTVSSVGGGCAPKGGETVSAGPVRTLPSEHRKLHSRGTAAASVPLLTGIPGVSSSVSAPRPSSVLHGDSSRTLLAHAAPVADGESSSSVSEPDRDIKQRPSAWPSARHAGADAHQHRLCQARSGHMRQQLQLCVSRWTAAAAGDSCFQRSQNTAQVQRPVVDSVCAGQSCQLSPLCCPVCSRKTAGSGPE